MKTKHKRLLAVASSVLFALVLTSCKTDQEKIRDAKADLLYFQDERSGLCFAFMESMGGDSRSRALASVPCEAIAELQQESPLK